MMKPLPKLFSLLLPLSIMAQTPHYSWMTQTRSGAWWDQGERIVRTSNGDIIATGTFTGTVDFDPGPGIDTVTACGWGADMYMVRYTASGSFLWVKRVITDSDCGARGITVDQQGNILVTGFFSGLNSDFDPGPGVCSLQYAPTGDLFVAKYDGNGNFIWAKQVGGFISRTEIGESIVCDRSGNVYVTGKFGHFYSGLDFDPGPGTFSLTADGEEDTFILKLDAAGNFVWAKNFLGRGPYDTGKGIALDAQNNIFVTGYFTGKTDFDPGPGTFTMAPPYWRDAYVVKLDSAGSFLWAAQLQCSTWADAEDIHVDQSGNVCAVGHFSGTADFAPGSWVSTATTPIARIFLWKLNSSGNLMWHAVLPGCSSLGENYSSCALTEDALGNIYATACFESTDDFDPGPGTFTLSAFNNLRNAYVVKLDQNGNFTWAAQLWSTDISEGFDIVTGNDGSIYTTGYFTAFSDFQPGPAGHLVQSSSVRDAFVWKLSQCNGAPQGVTFNGPGTVCAGQSFTLSASGCSQYLWSNNAQLPAISLSASANMTVNLKFTDADGCISDHDFYVTVDKCVETTVAAAAGQDGKPELYPNPCSGSLHVSGAPGQVCEVVSITGQIAFRRATDQAGNLAIQDLPAGIYLLKREGSPHGVRLVKN